MLARTLTRKLTGKLNGWIEEMMDIDKSPLTLCQILDAKAENMPGHIPMNVDGRAALSLGQWVEQSNKVAHALQRMALGKGEKVALLFDGLDWVDYAIAYMAALRCGATLIHLNGHLGEAEIMRRLHECEVTWLIKSPFIIPPRDFLGHIVQLGDLNLEDDTPLRVAVDPKADAEIRYTSGTTGMAKAYRVPHQNITFGRTLDTMEQLSSSASMLVPMTLGNSTSATLMSIAVTSQNCMILCSPVDIERMGELIEKEKVNSLMLTPYIAAQIVKFQLQKRHDLSSVKILASASSPLAPSLFRGLEKIFPDSQMQIACAQSEASPALLIHRYDPEYPFSVGKPSPNTEIRIVDQKERSVQNGHVGELWLKTAAPKRLFLNAPEVNEQLLKDGWYHTGDLVRKNDLGDVEFFDRKSDVLIKNGTMVSSIMVEAAILNHRAVDEVAVVSMTDKKGVNFMIAFMVLKDPDLLKEIKTEIRKTQPEDQCPDKFISVADLPRTDNGKILKRLLRLKLAGMEWAD